MLMNFKSDNYTGISTIAPSNLRLTEQKPSYILNKILEDFKSCTEISLDKRPDSLFMCTNGDFTIKLAFSKLCEMKLSDILESYSLSVRSLPVFLAIDIIYDIQPTCEKILQAFCNISTWRSYDLHGFITGHGFYYSAHTRIQDQWRSLNDGKMNSWVNSVWNFLVSMAYPSLIVLSNTGLRSPQCFISKIDLESMQKLAKLQDLRLKIVLHEEMPREILQETTTRVIFEKNLERKFETKEKRPQDENYRQQSADLTEKRITQSELARKDLKESLEEKGKKVDYEIKRDSYVSDDKDENKLYRSYKEKNYLETKKTEEIPDYRRSAVDFRPKDDLYESRRKETPRTYDANKNYTSQYRNYSTDPVSKPNAAATARNYQQDNYTKARNSSMGPKETSPRPGILKNSSQDLSRYPRNQSGQINSSITPLLSPRDSSGALSRTFRENTLPDRYEAETTEKPSSILRNAWIGDKDPTARLGKQENIEKKVNFSDSVYHIVETNKDQMPEIKLASVKIPEKKTVRKYEYRQDELRHSETAETQLHEYKSENRYQPNLQQPRNEANWSCPKCSASISNTMYECNNCRFINWDKFYSLKSKSPKIRSESIPIKSTEREDLSKSYRPQIDFRYADGKYESRGTPNKDLWKPREAGNEIKIQENYVSEDSLRRTSYRDYPFNR